MVALLMAHLALDGILRPEPRLDQGAASHGAQGLVHGVFPIWASMSHGRHGNTSSKRPVSSRMRSSNPRAWADSGTR